MDLGLYFRVIWRFRFFVVIGIIVALTLALLSVVKVSFSDGVRVAYRETPQWQSQALLLISQPGFPEGRAVAGLTDEGAATDPARLSNLPYLYAEMANGDEVRARFHQFQLPRGDFAAQPFTVTTANAYQLNLPLLGINGISDTPRNAILVTRSAARAFSEYLEEEQIRAGIPEAQRVVVPVLREPTKVQRVAGPKKTIPIVIFLAVMLAVVGLAFVLENLRPQIRLVRELETETRPRKLA